MMHPGPYRRVLALAYVGGRGAINGFRLTLACGHIVYRTVSWNATYNPARVRCATCAAIAAAPKEIP